MRLEDIFTYILTFALVSLLGFTITVAFWATWNDYVLFETVEFVETYAENFSLMSDNLLNSTVEGAKEYYNLSTYFDGWWLASYAMFLVASLVLAYRLPKVGYFNFTITLFYGSMVILFILGVLTTVTDWWQSSVLFVLVPSIQTQMPMFAYYLSHVGIISLVHVCACLLVNVLNFDFKGHGVGQSKEVVVEEEV